MENKKVMVIGSGSDVNAGILNVMDELAVYEHSAQQEGEWGESRIRYGNNRYHVPKAKARAKAKARKQAQRQARKRN